MDIKCSTVEIGIPERKLQSLGELQITKHLSSTLGKDAGALINEKNNKLHTLSAEIDYVPNADDNAEILYSAPQTYFYYYPFFRVSKITKNKYNRRPQKPLSNYANNYDKFPTIA